MELRNKHDRDSEWDKVSSPTQEEIITFNRKENRRSDKQTKMGKMWTVWKFTIGSFNDEKTKEHDNIVATLRTIIVGVNVLTCLIIVANIIHNW